MKYLGIDYGTKRIGLATSDESGTLAFPLTTIKSGPAALGELIELINKHEIEEIVLGESRNLKGQPNAVAEEIEKFKKDLAGLAGLPIHFEAEFFSSAQAARQFVPDGSRKQNPSQDKLDASAAAVILQSYLDRNKEKR